MTALSPAARAAIREAGFTQRQWCRMWGYADGRWGGDACGCQDDRCIGHHHEGADGCGCLDVMINDAVAWREATSGYPNEVRLTPASGWFRHVTVSTPGVLATVSATAGGGWTRPGAEPAPAESVVMIEAREGWTAGVSTDEHGRIVVRVVKAEAASAAGQEAAGA